MKRQRPYIYLAMLVAVCAGITLGSRRGDPPAPPPASATEIARESIRSYALALSSNLQQAADKWQAGEFGGPEAAHAWLLPRNDKDREKAFRPLNELLNEAGDDLAPVLRGASQGFAEAAQ